MNKKELTRYVKNSFTDDVTFNLELHNKVVYFSLFGYDSREVCNIEIPYKNKFEKEKIYIAIASLINSFDFSFRVTFSNVRDIYMFLGGNYEI